MSAGDLMAQWLVRQAAQRAPPPLSLRLEEEWLADLTAHRGWISRLRFALGCCWAASVIMHEHCGTSVAAAAGSASGVKTLTPHTRYDPPLFSRRTIVALLFIVGVHAVLIYALANGFGHKVIEAMPPMVGEFSPAPPKPIEPPPPPAEPRFAPWKVDQIPAPPFPVDSAPDADRLEAVPPEPQKSPSRPTAVTRVVGGPGKGFPNTAEYYPSASRRLGETGNAAVRVCVDSQGRLTTRPTIAQSSGSMRLDDSALRLAQDGSGHYRPTTEDGRPVDSCYAFRVRFELRD